MGNKASTQSNLIKEKLDYFSDNERQNIEILLKKLSDDSSNVEFQKHPFWPRLPQELQKGLLAFMQANSPASKNPPTLDSPVSAFGLIESARLLTKVSTFEKADAAFQLASLSCSSLRSFVEIISYLGVQEWWRGSGRNRDNFGDCNSENIALSRLVDYILVSYKLKPDIPEEEVEQEAMCWKRNCENAIPQINEFQDWFESTFSFRVLFLLIFRQLFFGRFGKEGPNLPAEGDLKHGVYEGVIAPPLLSPFKTSFSEIITPYDYFLLVAYLPPNCRQVNFPHQLLFSSRRDGASFTAFTNAIIDAGSTLLVVKDKNGKVFGGFADADWEQRPNFYGNQKNFLFTLDPLRLYRTSSYNTNFQYLNFGAQTLPNGLGMGGQLDYFGLWIASDFLHGHSKAGPLCSTYNSPCLATNQDFLVDDVEVWLVRPTDKDPTQMARKVKRSILDSNPEAMEILEMATNRKMYSKDVRDSKESEDEKEESDVK
ncbi:uncharacterized protein VTP21DRAFT_9490 [Calcarisporiella thermophila]|uniref:uncharacterized protein n=1 Tax=Calcarisporiella thermophila TaxID=911321 RepID=UPI0037441EA5